MASVLLNQIALSNLKSAIQLAFPNCKSSHLTESMAAALGFKTNAALKAYLLNSSVNRHYGLLDGVAFMQRLKELGNSNLPLTYNFESLKDLDGVISTVPSGAYLHKYGTKRQIAWRNIMVFSINEALKKELISLDIPSNWQSEPYIKQEPVLFDFYLPNDLPVRVYISDAGFYELSIHAAVNPKNNSVKAFNAGFNAGDAFATSWLERETGAWLQNNSSQFSCRKFLLESLASLEIKPLGYGDRGRIIL
ncbi:hypothetical protein ACMUMS_13575 [Acinetobacter courvalinii]|uniref:hypothetical protein n=1 Tax=Acinetobacter courvalinii TaxID=280147 RepID=UPI003A892BE0